MHKILIIMVLLIATGCGAKVTEPELTLYSFHEQNYPCFNIEFPEQVIYDGYGKSESDERILIDYQLRMPTYDVGVTKLYAKQSDLQYQSLSNYYDEKSIVHTIGDEQFLADKSGGVVIVVEDDALVIKGVVISYMQNNIAIRVDVSRPVKLLGTFNNNNVERWKNSTSGIKTIDNMIDIVEYIYNNIAPKECTINSNLNINLVN